MNPMNKRNLDLNPNYLFKFAEEDVNGVPLSSYSNFTFPNLIMQHFRLNLRCLTRTTRNSDFETPHGGWLKAPVC